MYDVYRPHRAPVTGPFRPARPPLTAPVCPTHLLAAEVEL